MSRSWRSLLWLGYYASKELNSLDSFEASELSSVMRVEASQIWDLVVAVSQGGPNWQGCLFKPSACTNQRNRGRTSADRSTRATLVLTVPRSLIKSSTKDLTWPSLEIVFRHTYTFRVQRCQGVVLIRDYCYSGNSGQGGYQPCQHGFWLRGVQS